MRSKKSFLVSRKILKVFVFILVLIAGYFVYRSLLVSPQIAEIGSAVPSRYGQSLEIIDANSAVVIPPIIKVDNFTFEAWINPTIQDKGFIFSQGGDNPLALVIQSNPDSSISRGSLTGRFRDADRATELTTEYVVEFGKWSHVVFQRDFLRTSIYLNGQLVVSQGSNPNKSLSPTKNLTIGGLNTSLDSTPSISGSFLGRLDSVKFSKGAKYKTNFEVPLESILEPGTIASYQFEGDYKNSLNWEANIGTPVGGGLMFADSVPYTPSNPISWRAQTASSSAYLKADNFYFVVNNRRYDTNSKIPVNVQLSDSRIGTQTLTASWSQYGHLVTVSIEFYQEANYWGVSRITTNVLSEKNETIIIYSQKNSFEKIDYPKFIDRFHLISTDSLSGGTGYLMFNNLEVLAFQKDLPVSSSPKPSPVISSYPPKPSYFPTASPVPSPNPQVVNVINVYAAGTASFNDGEPNWNNSPTYPTMVLKINGKAVKKWEQVKGNPSLRKFIKYTYSYASSSYLNLNDKIQVVYLNDYGKRDLRVNKIEVNGISYQSEDPLTYLSSTCQKGYLKTEWLKCNGYFVYQLKDLFPPAPSVAPSPSPFLSRSPFPSPLISAFPSPSVSPN